LIDREDRSSIVTAMVRDGLISASNPTNSSGRVLPKYRGIDGFPWPDRAQWSSMRFEHGVACVDQIGEVLELLRRQPESSDVELLYVESESGSRQFSGPPTGFAFAGFDVGYIDSDLNCFSVVLNEVLVGSLSAMRQLSEKLNENLLFRSPEGASTALAVRKMFPKGTAELEDFDQHEELQYFAVYVWEG
jgi:hypothetical protein